MDTYRGRQYRIADMTMDKSTLPTFTFCFFQMAAVEEIYVQILFYRTATLARVVQQVTRPNNNLLSSACLRASMRTCLAI